MCYADQKAGCVKVSIGRTESPGEEEKSHLRGKKEEKEEEKKEGEEKKKNKNKRLSKKELMYRNKKIRQERKRFPASEGRYCGFLHQSSPENR